MFMAESPVTARRWPLTTNHEILTQPQVTVQPGERPMSDTPTRRQKLEGMLAQEPDDPFLQYALAMECAAQGDHHAAIEGFEKLLRQHPDYIPAYHQYGKLLLQLGQQEEAQRVLRHGIHQARRVGDLHAAEEMEALITSLA